MFSSFDSTSGTIFLSSSNLLNSYFSQEFSILLPNCTILNKQSGVNAISGVSSDDRDICAAQNAGNKRASLAHEMQAYEIAKFIGSYIAAMNGVDGIVFTGGIGENGHWLRSRICSYLGYMGVQIDEELNQATVKGAEAELTDPSAKVRVFILATDEELVIAQETQKVVESLQK